MNFKRKTYFLFLFNIQFVECIDHTVDGGKTQEKRWRSIISQVNLWERYSYRGPQWSDIFSEGVLKL